MVEAVLLYYGYAAIDDPEEVVGWLESISGGLVGRVRVAKEGINATLGGELAALEAYVTALREARPLMFGDVDFKLDRVTPDRAGRAADPALIRECGFEGLRHRVVDEIVSFGDDAGVFSSSNNNNDDGAAAPQRLSRREWDAALARPDAVVVDVRNSYESAVGRFVCPATVLAPQVRSTSGFAQWLDGAHLPERRDVFLYCTGGVRCETAARLVRRKKNPSSISLLEGGVLKYLQDVKATGENNESLFHGRLFVFDPRVSVPGVAPLGDEHAPTCARCRRPNVGDYCLDDDDDDDIERGQRTPRLERTRCARCRILVLVCADCRSALSSERGKEKKNGDGPLLCPACSSNRCPRSPRKRILRRKRSG